MSDFTEKVRAMLDAATKEPWEASDESDSHYDVCIGETICSLDRANSYTGKYVISREEMTANAHLIIAAPTLLREAVERIEALEKVSERSRAMVDLFIEKIESGAARSKKTYADALEVREELFALNALDAVDAEEE